MSDDTKRFIFAVLLVCAAVLGVAWLIYNILFPFIGSVIARGGEIAEANQARVAKVQSSPWYADDYGTVKVWTDPETRCQYLFGRVGYASFFVERKRDGRHICGEVAK